MKYASQIFGDALAPLMKADSKKLSSLEPGQIVRLVDGSAYRVSSKTASPKGIAYKLADLSGKPVPTPANFRPVGLAMARFASWLRYHLAYNKDFDLYVNSYIEKYNSEHPDKPLPYPVGPDGKPFRWSDWFQRSIASKLYVNVDPQQAQAMKEVLRTGGCRDQRAGSFQLDLPIKRNKAQALAILVKCAMFAVGVDRDRSSSMTRKKTKLEGPREQSLAFVWQGAERCHGIFKPVGRKTAQGFQCCFENCI